MTSKAKAAFLTASDSPAKLRTGDAWRVYDEALKMKVVAEVKEILRKENPPAFKAMCEYEADEIESAL